MKPFEDIEKFIRHRKPHSATSPRMDKRTLNDSLAAMDQTMRAKPADLKSGRQRINIHSRTAIHIAAAAIIIPAIVFLVIRPAPDKKDEIPKVPDAAKSPAEMLTAKSLMTTYRDGGMEAVEIQMDEALEKLEPHTATITVQELLAEFNGT